MFCFSCLFLDEFYIRGAQKFPQGEKFMQKRQALLLMMEHSDFLALRSGPRKNNPETLRIIDISLCFTNSVRQQKRFISQEEMPYAPHQYAYTCQIRTTGAMVNCIPVIFAVILMITALSALTLQKLFTECVLIRQFQNSLDLTMI